MNAHARPLILVADDDEDIVELVRIRMERLGYESVRASDGAEALRVARDRHPDLCILDVVMPQKTGYDVVEALRADAALAEVPVILMTATVQERERARSMEAGASAHITKPFDAAELERLVADLLPASG